MGGLAERRCRMNLGQEELAEMVGVGVATIRRWESGVTAWPQGRNRRRLRDALQLNDEELLALLSPGGQPSRFSATSARAAEPFTLRSRSHGPEAAMQAFRAADRQIGGGHLYAAVVEYLHMDLAPRLFADASADGRPVFTAAAALTEMAGWMAHDAGRDPAARSHFARALDLVGIAGDGDLEAHIRASQSHIAHLSGSPDEAIALAEQGLERLRDRGGQPELKARLIAMQARGFAGQKRVKECIQLLDQAEQLLIMQPDREPSPWVSRFDEAALASESARCLRQLGDLRGTQRHAERVIELRIGDRTRSRALGQLTLVAVLIPQGQIEEACAVAHDVLETTRQLDSHQVIQQLLGLRKAFKPYRDYKIVTDFLGGLEEARNERMWSCPSPGNEERRDELPRTEP